MATRLLHLKGALNLPQRVKPMNRHTLLAIVFSCLLVTTAAASPVTIIGDSAFLSASDAEQLGTWLGQGPIQLTKVFSKSLDAQSALDFHAAVDGRGPTFVVLSVWYFNGPYSCDLNSCSGDARRALIGGYNPVSWDSEWDAHYAYSDADRTAFLFNLTTGVVQREKLNSDLVCPDCGALQTQNLGTYGPWFGDLDLYMNYWLAGGTVRTYAYGPSTFWDGGTNILGLTGATDFSFGDPRWNPMPLDTAGGMELFTVQAVPEPTSMILLACGLAGLARLLPEKRPS
jgi:hypothetical protein